MIGTQHGPVPDAGFIVHYDMADQHRGRGDEGARRYLWSITLEFDKYGSPPA
jgi:hypothetical protein